MMMMVKKHIVNGVGKKKENYSHALNANIVYVQNV